MSSVRGIRSQIPSSARSPTARFSGSSRARTEIFGFTQGTQCTIRKDGHQREHKLFPTQHQHLAGVDREWTGRLHVVHGIYFQQDRPPHDERTTHENSPVTAISSLATPEPDGIVAGADGRLWFTEFAGAAIGAITTNGIVTVLPTPDRVAETTYIATGAPGGDTSMSGSANSAPRA